MMKYVILLTKDLTFKKEERAVQSFGCKEILQPSEFSLLFTIFLIVFLVWHTMSKNIFEFQG